MQQLPPGATLQSGKYIIDRVLGQGGFGITYLALHSILEKRVAIKEFFPKNFCERNSSTSHITLGNSNTSELVSKLKEKFIKEARNISKLVHPNIVAIHDIFEENGTAYYLMDYIDGESLSDKIKSDGFFQEWVAIDFVQIIGSAIEYMHSKSMNHLDIKPANIMLRASDNAPVLIDFGLSKQYDSSGEQTSTTPVGISHGYAPIEQYRPGGVSTFSPQTDVYALGATLLALLLGNTPPHYSDILEDGLPKLPSSISRQTVKAIEKAMEIKKTKRPATIGEFISMLPESILSDSTKPTHTGEVEETIVKTSEKPSRQKENQKENLEVRFEEETVILNVPLSSSLIANAEIYPEVTRVSNSQTPELEYLDLGLNVKWATQLSGIANPVLSNEVYQFKAEDGTKINPSDFIASHSLPTINHFQELIERCSWTIFSENGMHGYKITGPNGNILMMPLGIINRHLTAECLKPDCLYYYFLYLGEYTHTLEKGIPTDANIWTIKE